MRAILLSFALLLCAASPLWSAVGEHAGSKYLVRGVVSIWNPTLGGDFNFDDPGSTFDTDIDASDLSLDDAANTLKWEVGVNLPLIFDLTVGGFGFSNDASNVLGLGEDFSFGDEDFGAGEDVTSELSVDDLYVEFGFRLLNLDIAGFWLGFALHSQNVETKISSPGKSDAIDENLIFPTLTARGFVNLPKNLTLEGKIHILGVTIDDYMVEYLEMHIQLGWRPFHNVGFVAGWQIVSMDIDFDDIGGIDDVKLAYDLAGPYIGVLAQF